MSSTSREQKNDPGRKHSVPESVRSASNRGFRLLLAGGIAGIITKTATAPLERVKILLQLRSMSAATAPSSPSILGTMRSVLKENGALGFWKGNGANCIRVIPVYGLKFGLNDAIKDFFRTSPGAKLTRLEMFRAGTISGMITVSLTYPLDMIRTRLSLARGFGVHYKGIVDCAKTTVRKEGFRALYGGYWMTLLSGSPYVGLQMTGYEYFKDLMPANADGSISPIFKAMAGMFAGVTAQTVTFPGDVVRRRMQTNGAGGKLIYDGNMDCLIKIARNDGPIGFYAGWRANVVRSLPAAALQFLAYDTAKQMFGL